MEMTAIAIIRDVEVPLIGVKFQDIYLNVFASLNPSSIMDSKIDMRLMIVKLWGLFNLEFMFGCVCYYIIYEQDEDVNNLL